MEQSKMSKVSRNILERPLMASIVILFAAIGADFIPLSPLLQNICGEQASDYLDGIIKQVLITIALIAGLKKIGLFEEAGFRCKVKDLWIGWPMILFCLLMVFDFQGGGKAIDWNKSGIIILFVLTYLSTGLFEETVCRGVVFNLMNNKWGKTRRGCYLALFLSSLLFGVSHFIHFFLGNEDLIQSLAQVMYATFFGVFFCGCFVRNKSIYPIMILHGLLDIVCDLDEIVVGGGIDKSMKTMSIEGATVLVGITVPFLIYGFWCVRKEFAKPIEMENNRDKWTGGDCNL